MADTSKTWDKKPREMFYYRQRYKNRVFNRLAAFFADEAQQRGISKKLIAERLGKDPAQITRWLAAPANLTMDTISDLLFAMEAEPEPPRIVRLVDKPRPNYIDPLIAEIVGMPQRPPGGRVEHQSTDSSATLSIDARPNDATIYRNELVL